MLFKYLYEGKKKKTNTFCFGLWTLFFFFFWLVNLCARYHIMSFSWLNISNTMCSLKLVVKDKVKRAQKN